MTNEEAIEMLKKDKEQRGDCFISDALDMAIKALEQQPCEDTISRQVVLDKIKEVCFSKEQKWVDFRVSQGSNGERDFIINFIETLPGLGCTTDTKRIEGLELVISKMKAQNLRLIFENRQLRNELEQK